MKYQYSVAIIVSLSLLSPSANSQDLSLESIFNLESTVASKKSVKQSDAPGFITVYTADDIKRLGYKTLADLASITAGYSDANIFLGQRNLIVRGQTQTGFDNNKVLVLVDGIPVNHLRNGKAPIAEDLNLIGVEKVEFLKGPASALYGTGAFFGVIKVTTQRAKSGEAKAEVSLYNGSFGAHGVSGYTVSNKEGLNFVFRASNDKRNASLEKRGLDDNDKAVEDGARGTSGATNWLHDRSESAHSSAEVKIEEGSLKGLTLGYESNVNRNGTHEDNGWSSGDEYPGNTYKFSYYHTYAKYDYKISDAFAFNSYLKMANASEEGSAYNYNHNFSGVEALAELSYDISEKNSIVTGVNYDSRKADNKFSGTVEGAGTLVEAGSKPLNTTSLYAQYSSELDVGRGLLLTTGFRFDKASSKTADFQQLSPRLSLVQKITETTNFKLLYGTALKAPDLKATFINEQVLEEGNNLFKKNLKPETVSSLELGVTYNVSNISASLTAFSTSAQDIISRRTFDTKDSYRNDEGVTKGNGIELETKYGMGTDTLFFNATYAKSELPDNNDTIYEGQRVSNGIETNMNLGYLGTSNAFGYAIIVKHIGGIIGDSATEEKTYPAFLLADVNLTYAYAKNLEFTSLLKNMTGTKARVGGFKEVYSPQGVYVGLNYNF